MSIYPIIKLREILILDLVKIPLDVAAIYEMVGVYSFGRGLFDREPVSGRDTSYNYFYQLKAEHVVMSQLFGWEGALALSSEQFDGKYVSPQFPTFLVDETRLDRKYLGWAMRRPIFWKDLGSRAKGMGDRRRTLNPDALFECEIPLPPLAEQRRIVAYIEALAARLAEARGLRQGAVADVEKFIESLHLQLSGSREVVLADIMVLDERSEAIKPFEEYDQVGVYSFGRGLFSKGAIKGHDTKYTHFNKLFEGAVVLSQLFGWEGAVAVCNRTFDGFYASKEFRTFHCISSEVNPEYLTTLVRIKWFWTKLQTLTTGMGDRRQRVKPDQFLQLRLPMPPLEDQNWAVSLFNALQHYQSLSEAILPELDALLPSVLDRAFKGEL